MINETEPNNNFTNANEISFNQEITGKLINTSDYDVYKFYVDKAMKISFEFTEDSPNTNHRWDARILSDDVTYDIENSSKGRFIVNSEEYMFNEHTGGAGEGFEAFFDTSGWYYLEIRQTSSNFQSDSNYSFVLKSTIGKYYNEYEYNDTLFTANIIPTEQTIFGNLYEAEKTQDNDIDFYKFSLPSNHDKINIYFNTNGADETNTDSWNVEIFDSLTIAKLGEKEFFDSGELSISTNSTGDFYIKISQANETVNLDSGFYKFEVVTSSGNTANTSSGANSNTASSDNFGATDGDDPNIVLTSGNDEFTITKGKDSINGGLGDDTIVLSSRDSANYIIPAVDKNSNYTGIANQKFVYIELKNSDGYSVAYNFEKIKVGSQSYDIETFNEKGYFVLNNYRNIPDQNLTTISETKSIDLEYYIYSINQGASYTYEITSNINENIKDQIEINGNKLILTPGEGEIYTETITVKGQEIGRGDESKTQDIVITIGDNKTSSSTDVSNNNDNTINIDSGIYNGTDEIDRFIYDVDFSGSEVIAIDKNITINNFDLSNDKIILRGIDAPSISGGSLFTSENVEVTLDEINNKTYIYFSPDGNGNSNYISLNEILDKDLSQITFSTIDGTKNSSENSDNSDNSGSGIINHSSGADIIVPSNSLTYRGLGGEDVYIIHNLSSKEDIVILDKEGSKIQLVNGLSISKSIFTSDSVELTLSNNSTIRIFLADKSIFEIGGNFTTGVKGINYSFEKFAELMGINALPNRGSIEGKSYIKVEGSELSQKDINTYTSTKSSSKLAEGSDAKFTITASSPVSSDTTFSWSAMGDTNGDTVAAADNSDIKILSGSATIESGSTSTTFTVGAVADAIVEGLEGIKVSVFDSNASLIYSSNLLIENVLTESAYILSLESNENGPNLNEYSKTYTNSGTFNAKEANEIIILSGQAGNIRGLGGDDTYIISDLITADAKTQIIDTSGNNTIQIPDNTKITKVLFTSNAARLWLKNNQEITISAADKFTYNVSGNSVGGDEGENFTYDNFVDLFNVSIGSGTNNVDLFTKSNSSATSKYNIIEISNNEDTSISGTTNADDFRYEITSAGVSKEGAFKITIENFDKSSDKLTLVIDGDKSLTTQELDQLVNVEVTSDGISGTQILFAPDSNAESGLINITNIDEPFDNYWIAETYNVEITPNASLASTIDKNDLSYSFSYTTDNNKPILSPFNTSTISGTANFINQSEIIILTGQAETYRGLSGDDTYIVSELIPENSKISITDTEGNNIIEIPDNTYIDASLFTKNAARITLSNNKQITISGADKFTYNLGSNITTGVESKDLTFTEFASAFGVEDILNSDGATEGIISDQYII